MRSRRKRDADLLVQGHSERLGGGMVGQEAGIEEDHEAGNYNI